MVYTETNATPSALSVHTGSLPMDRNPAAVYLASLRASGRRTMRQALDTLAAIVLGTFPEVRQNSCLAFPWWELRYTHTAAIRAQLADRYKPASANKMLTALRRVLRECWLLELMGSDDYTHAASVEAVAGSSLPAGREVTPLEIAALTAACTNEPAPIGIRDAALLATLYPGGLRREEVIRLNLADYDPETQILRVKGKRGKDREVPITDAGALRAISDWLQARGGQPGPLFVAIRRNGNLAADRLNNQTVYDVLRQLTQRAGLEALSPHDLRRTAATHLLDAGADVLTVARYLGHSNVQTTGKYDRRNLKAMRKAAGALHLPYQGRSVR